MGYELWGKNVVMAGRFEQGRERLKLHFERLGAQFQDSLRGDTDILLVGKAPGRRVYELLDMLRGSGYDIAIWEQKEINEVWSASYHEHMTQDDIDEEERLFNEEMGIVGEREDGSPIYADDPDAPKEEEDEHPGRWVKNGCLAVLVELIATAVCMLVFLLGLSNGSLLVAGLGIVLLAIAARLELTPIMTAAAEEERGNGFWSTLGNIITLGIFMPTSKHRQWRAWQYGRRHSRRR